MGEIKVRQDDAPLTPVIKVNTAIVTLIILCVIQIVALGSAYGQMKEMLDGINYRVIRIEHWIDSK